MVRALLALALALSLGNAGFSAWEATLFQRAVPAAGEAGNKWDPNGSTVAYGGLWDPNGATADFGNMWDPNS
jgi:hypothetical protein